MKGIVFNLLQETIEQRHGADAWDDILGAAGVVGAYTSLGSYPDSDLARLLRATADRIALPREAALRWFGRQALPLLAQRYPAFFAGHRTVETFVLTLNDVIHPEVRKLYPGASTPSFEFTRQDDGRLRMVYQSDRRLCALAEGLVAGAADHFGEQCEIEHPSCISRGDARCVFEIALSPRPSA